MAGLHLVRNRLRDIFETEQAALLSHARMEHDLQQQVAQFLAQFRHGVTLDRVGDLVGFLDRVRRDAGEILRQIPFAAVFGIAQPRHDGEQAIDLGFRCVRHDARVGPRARRVSSGLASTLDG